MRLAPKIISTHIILAYILPFHLSVNLCIRHVAMTIWAEMSHQEKRLYMKKSYHAFFHSTIAPTVKLSYHRLMKQFIFQMKGKRIK